MTVWTISAQKGTGGAAIAATLAAGVGVPLLDQTALTLLANDPRLGVAEIGGLEERLADRMGFALAVAAMGFVPVAVPDVLSDLELRRTLAARARTLLAEVARTPCVIIATAAFAVLDDHPAAIHARVWAPFDWRVEHHHREHLVDRRAAQAAVKHDDKLQRAWAKTLYNADLTDARPFTLTLDASRLSQEQIIDILRDAAA